MRTRPSPDEIALGTLLLVLLGLLLLGALSAWPHGPSGEYFPGGALGGVLLVVVLLMSLGELPRLLVAKDLLHRALGSLPHRLHAPLPHGSHARRQPTEAHAEGFGEGGREARREGLVQ